MAKNKKKKLKKDKRKNNKKANINKIKKSSPKKKSNSQKQKQKQRKKQSQNLNKETVVKQKSSKDKNKNKKKKPLWLKLIIIIACLGLCYSVISLEIWLIDRNKLKDQIDDVMQDKVKKKKDTDKTEIINQETIDEFDPYWDYIKMNLIDVDFNELKRKNR